MRASFDAEKREATLRERGLDMARAHEVFAGLHITRIDDREDYGERRYVSAGWMNGRIVIVVWTPREASRRVISMRHCHEREAKKLRPLLVDAG